MHSNPTGDCGFHYHLVVNHNGSILPARLANREETEMIETHILIDLLHERIEGFVTSFNNPEMSKYYRTDNFISRLTIIYLLGDFEYYLRKETKNDQSS